MTEFEIGAHWAAIVGYALASLAAGAGVIFARARLTSLADGLLLAGTLVHGAALALRWAATGHGPYLGRYEAFSSHALAIVAVYLVLRWRFACLRSGGILVGPAALLLAGVAVSSPAAPTYPSPALASPWLRVHVSFAKLALATTIASCVPSLLLLVRAARGGSSAGEVEDWKGRAALDTLSHRLVAYTFFLMTVVILSGAIWAQAAWGSYWSWDPVEVWSLAFWTACALVLHARSTGGWVGSRWAGLVLAVGALGVASFIGYGHVGVSLHAAYIAP